MNPQPPLTPEIERVLGRYLEIQQEAHRLEEEKDQLRDILAAHLADLRGLFWFPVVAGCPLRVRYSREVRVDYDAALLQKRLGERYVHVLKPDMAKLRKHLAEVEPRLAPVLSLIGSPSADRVRAAISKGLVAKEEFAGAFKKTLKCNIAVMRVRDQAPVEGAPPTW
ncbi:MAG: hypothetical protein FJ291_19945 [Planctomycetes bacterium]|nr:hypothetical protein [Planctomycetota bacterium]